MQRTVPFLAIATWMLASAVPVDAERALKVDTAEPLRAFYSWERFCSNFLSVNGAHSLAAEVAGRHDARVRRSRTGTPRHPRLHVGCVSTSGSSQALVLVTTTLERPVWYQVRRSGEATVYRAVMHGSVSTSLTYFPSARSVREQLPRSVRTSIEGLFEKYSEVNQGSVRPTRPGWEHSEEVVSGTGLEVSTPQRLHVNYESCHNSLPDLRPAMKTSADRRGIALRFISLDELEAENSPPAAVVYCQADVAPPLYYYYVIDMQRNVIYDSGGRLYRGSAFSTPRLVLGSTGTGLLEKLLQWETIKSRFLDQWSAFLDEYIAANR